jgi:hypothetical protein
LDAERESELRRVLNGVTVRTGELDPKDSEPRAGSGGWSESLQDPDMARQAMFPPLPNVR